MNRILTTFFLFTLSLAVAGPDPRAGLWEGNAMIGGRQQTLWLLLRISLPLEDRKYPYNGLWIPPIYGLEEDHFCGVSDVQLRPDHISLRCERYDFMQRNDASRPENFFEGSFDPDAGITGVWRVGDQVIPVHYTRPPRASGAALVGDWTTSGVGPVGRTCVLHLFDGLGSAGSTVSGQPTGTMDVFSDNEGAAMFGQPIEALMQPDGSVFIGVQQSFSHRQFVGVLNKNDGTLTGTWRGSDPGCGERLPGVTLRQTSPPSNQRVPKQ